MEDEKKLAEYLASPEAPIDKDWVLAMLERYPAFYFPAALLLKRSPRSLDAETQQTLRTAIILNCPDRLALADFTDIVDADWSNIYPRESIGVECSTDEAIDTFIDTYGQRMPDEDDMLEKLIFTPTPDYFAGTDEPYDPSDPLALPPELMPGASKQKTEAPVETKEEISTHTPVETPIETRGETQVEMQSEPAIAEAPREEETPKPPKTDNPDENITFTPSTPGEEPSLMESLSKFFIKQHRYERAYEIISKLSLNYPEKSVYFADQMRFLQKLILNQQCFKNKI